jgi:DNA-binding LacI/PurR family transcriptional regulator
MASTRKGAGRKRRRTGATEIAAALRAELTDGALRAGASLPPVDALRRRFGAGEFAVRHALQLLRDDGLIVLKRSLGARVAPKAGNAWKGTVAFIALSVTGSYYPDAVATHLSRRLESAGWRFAPIFPEIAPDGSLDETQLRRHLANGVDFAVGLFARPTLSAMLARAGVPHVIVNGFNRDFPDANAVFKVDISSAFAELLDAFRAAKVKTVAEFDYERVMDRSFKLQLAAGGFDVQRIMLPTDGRRIADLYGFRAAGYAAVSEFLATRGSRKLPDAILFDDDYFAMGGFSALLEAGLRIPRDIRVATFMNRGNELAFERKITGFGQDPAAVATAIADYAIAFLNGANPRPSRLRWRFFPGETV